jgi:hypothetical protein
MCVAVNTQTSKHRYAYRDSWIVVDDREQHEELIKSRKISKSQETPQQFSVLTRMAIQFNLARKCQSKVEKKKS